MVKLKSFVVNEKGATPEEAFLKAKQNGFGKNIYSKDYMVFVKPPKRRKAMRYMCELLETDVFLRDPNGPVGCMLARPAGELDVIRFSGVGNKETVYLLRDDEGTELYSLSDELQAGKEARQWALESGISISVVRQIRDNEKILEYQVPKDNHLNEYWFFGWTMGTGE